MTKTIYTLYVDGVPIKMFSRKPQKSVVALTRLKGIELDPPLANTKADAGPLFGGDNNV